MKSYFKFRIRGRFLNRFYVYEFIDDELFLVMGNYMVNENFFSDDFLVFNMNILQDRKGRKCLNFRNLVVYNVLNSYYKRYRR